MRQLLAESEKQRYLILTLELSQIEKEVLLSPMPHLFKAANFESFLFEIIENCELKPFPNPGFEGQSIFETVANQTALNSLAEKAAKKQDIRK